MIERNGLKVVCKGVCMHVVPQGEMQVLCSDLHIVVLDEPGNRKKRSAGC